MKPLQYQKQSSTIKTSSKRLLVRPEHNLDQRKLDKDTCVPGRVTRDLRHTFITANCDSLQFPTYFQTGAGEEGPYLDS